MNVAEGAAAEREVMRFCDFTEFTRHLGIDPNTASDSPLMVAARRMFADPLPPLWSEQVDEASSRVYFFHRITGESLWMHPQESLFREIVAEVGAWKADEGETTESVLARSEGFLRLAHGRALDAIAQWSGPYDVPQGGPEEAAPEDEGAQQFYFNSATGESCWSDPRQSVEFDLRQVHAVLCDCLAAFAAAQKADVSSEEDDLDRSRTFGQSFRDNLMLSLKLPLAAMPMDASPPSGAGTARPSHLPPEIDTSRSGATYLTARSEVADTARRSHDSSDDHQGHHPFVLQAS